MTAQLPISTDVQRAKLTARDFWTLADSGAFEGLAKTELIEGDIWVVNSVHSWHAKTLMQIGFELETAVRMSGSELTVYASGSIDLSEDSVPEPDVSVGEDDDGKGLPLAKLRLAIEVSDSTLGTDLGRKARLYARHGVPEYWVVDREGRRVVQMWKPSADGYRQRCEFAFGEPVAAATIEELRIATDRL